MEAPQRTSRQHQADETRARLLAVAWEMIREEGVAEFTVRKLAHRAHVSVGLPHAHFGTREELVDALRVRAWDEIDFVIAQAVGEATLGPETSHPRARYEGELRRGLEAVVAFALQEPNVYDLVALTPGLHVSDRVLVRELQTAQRFIAMLGDGQRAGAFRFKDDPGIYALALWTAVQGYVQRVRATMAPGFQAYQARVFDVLVDVFLDAVRAEDARESNE